MKMAEQKTSLVVESDLQKKIVGLLGTKGPMTRRDMVNHLKIARTTIYDTLFKLMNRNVVDKYPVNNSKRGRPTVVFTLKNGIVAV